MSTEVICEVLKLLDDNGIWLSIDVRGSGSFCIEGEKVITYLRDPIKYQAKLLGVTKTQYERWLEYIDNDMADKQCKAISSKKKRCKHDVSYQHPGDMPDSDDHLFCDTHAGGV